MGAAVADHGGKPLVDAALILLGALVRVELNAGKVLLDGGILLGHGAELIILRAQGSVLRAQRFGLGTQRGQLIIGCIQRGTQGVALRRGVAVLLGEAVVFSPRRVLTCVRSSCSCAQSLSMSPSSDSMRAVLSAEVF